MANSVDLLKQSFLERLLPLRKDTASSSDLSRTSRDGCGLYSVWADFKATSSRLYEMGRSDPRKVIFATKMGLSLALVSVFIFVGESSTIIRNYSIWAVLTVVVTFEFSIGAFVEF